MTLTDITPEEERMIEAAIKGHPLLQPRPTYRHRYACSNCGYMGDVDIQVGTKVKHHRCPRCACTDADLTGT